VETPLISIILPVFNGERYLAKSIESCLNQTYSAIELIIVNDASTDNSFKIAERYAKTDSRIHIINNETNLKLPASLNHGHDYAKGSYITWTSDDNNYHQNAIETYVRILRTTKSDIVYSDYELIDEEGRFLRYSSLSGINNLLFGNHIGASFMYKKEVFSTLRFNEDFFRIEDYDFWLRASLKFKFFKIDEVLYSYRLHSESLTKSMNFEIDQKLRNLYLKMYRDFVSLSEHKGNDQLHQLLFKLSRIESLDMLKWIDNFKTIDDFLVHLEKKSTVYKYAALRKVTLKQMRAIIMLHKEHQKSKILLKLFIKLPDIFRGFSIKTSLKIINKSIF